jgi:glycosyltransferase involved in cell wall biosynthesis
MSEGGKLGTVTVLMPNYNHARFLPHSLEAIARQTVLPLEVIVIDDGSTDDSVAVVRSFAKQLPGLRLLRHEANQGAFPALRTGWKECRGDYVFFATADDVLLPGFFEKSLSLLARHPQAGFCSTLSRILSEDGRDLGPYHTPIISPQPCYLSPAEYMATYLREGHWVVGYSAMFRRAAVEESGAFELVERLPWHIDGYMVSFTGAKYGACFIPEPLVMWRRQEDSWGFQLLLRQGLDGLDTGKDLEDCLRQPRCAGLFPEEFFQSLWRQTIDVTIYEYSRRRPDELKALAALEKRLPHPGWLDRAYFGALRRGWAGLLATKAYLTWHKPWPERWRILRGKLPGGRRAGDG